MKSAIRNAFVFLGVLLPVSCSEKPAQESGAEPQASNEINAEEVVILTWEEYFNPEVIEKFEAETGVEVVFRYFDNLDEMQNLIESERDGFDLIVADGGSVADLIDLRLLQPVQPEKIPNLKNLDDRYLDLAFDPNNHYSIPYMWGSTLITYRSDLIPEPAHSWKSLWDEKYAGKILMVDDQFDCYAVALLSLGYDLNSQNPQELKEATDHLVRQVNELGAEFTDIITIREKLFSGECWISVSYSSDAPVLAEENEAISYFIPEEGAPLWVDSFVIAGESPNPENAHQFLNFMADAEIAAENSNYLWCATTNREARPYLSEEVLAEDTLYPSEETMARCQFDKQQSAQRNMIVNRGMKAIYDSLQKRARNAPETLVKSSDASEDEGGDQ